MKKQKNWILFPLLLLLLQGCIEPFDFNSTTTENNLVVRALLTNELKKHSIELSKTIPIDLTKLEPEKNAIVTITDDTGNIYNFQENEEGIYTSNTEFSAKPKRAYTLEIKTQNGNTYISSAEKLPATSEIQDINFNVENNVSKNIQEVVLRVNSILSGNQGNYYRYEYDETYKIRPPYWSSRRVAVISDVPPYKFEVIDKEPDVYGVGFCYPTNSSNEIILTETKSLTQDQVLNFPVRKIPINSYFVGIRYSILLKQYTLNQNTFDFYNLLDKFSDPDNIFSQIQVGNIPSNISHKTDINKNKVIGFFEVSSIHTKRIFFNRKDFITDPLYKNYLTVDNPTCSTPVAPEAYRPNRNDSPLLDNLQNGWIFRIEADDLNNPNRPYYIVRKNCGDCSHLGKVIAPDFWID